MPAANVLPPGSTIGILGGGQLGRMLALAAARLGFRCHIFSPDAESPAFDVTTAHTIAAFDDLPALESFAAAVGVVTFEFENVDVRALSTLSALVPVRPGLRALEVSQDRYVEKTFLKDLGIATAPFAAVEDLATLEATLRSIPPPVILKTRRFGYDGKGQVRIARETEAAAAFAVIGKRAALLEGVVDFKREIAVVAARSLDGDIVVYDPAENFHPGGILHTSTVPARVQPGTMEEAARIAAKVLKAFDYVGVIAVEFFVLGEGIGEQLIVNEIAPRVHNSGHWTEDACAVSQFENHIRAIAGWPLGPAARHSDVVMTNLIGSQVEAWRDLAAEPDARLHLYGKRQVRPGRKLGHVNRLFPRSGF
jgi:5-(carboxyamino)imidazole ribonucleotide synthase